MTRDSNTCAKVALEAIVLVVEYGLIVCSFSMAVESGDPISFVAVFLSTMTFGLSWIAGLFDAECQSSKRYSKLLSGSAICSILLIPVSLILIPAVLCAWPLYVKAGLYVLLFALAVPGIIFQLVKLDEALRPRSALAQNYYGEE